jgi:hypothetical protein
VHIVGSRQAEEEAWALAADVVVHREKEVMEVAEDAASQAVALLQSQFVDISTAGPFLGSYRVAVDLMASADDAAMAEAYVVGMVVPQEQPDEEDDVDDDIEALFGDTSDGNVIVPAITDEQVALLASFKTAHQEEGTRQFMAAEREAFAAMLVVHANAAREAMRVAAKEEAARVAEAARAAAREEELAKEAAADATTQEEMAKDRRRWDDDVAVARCTRKIHELATQRSHRRNLAEGEGSNAVDAG